MSYLLLFFAAVLNMTADFPFTPNWYDVAAAPAWVALQPGVILTAVRQWRGPETTGLAEGGTPAR